MGLNHSCLSCLCTFFTDRMCVVLYQLDIDCLWHVGCFARVHASDGCLNFNMYLRKGVCVWGTACICDSLSRLLLPALSSPPSPLLSLLPLSTALWQLLCVVLLAHLAQWG